MLTCFVRLEAFLFHYERSHKLAQENWSTLQLTPTIVRVFSILRDEFLEEDAIFFQKFATKVKKKNFPGSKKKNVSCSSQEKAFTPNEFCQEVTQYKYLKILLRFVKEDNREAFEAFATDNKAHRAIRPYQLSFILGTLVR
jgi:hypothetical protein